MPSISPGTRGSYKPKCSTAVGVSALPGGKAYYAFRIRQQTTTNRTAEEIHELGLSEVARIRAEMEQVAKKAGFASREAMIADLRTNPKYYAKTPEELMEATARETKRIDGKMPSLFTAAAAPALRHPRDPGRDRARARRPLITTRARPRTASPGPITSTRRSSTSGRCGKSRR